jgi:hypothetical protein
MNEALATFARHTRHSARELDQNPGLIARKYLAAHLGYEAYAHVADDYEWVKTRTHNPPLEAYQTDRLPEENAFVELMKKGWKSQVPSFADMPKLGTFYESTASFSDLWRARAAFLIAHRPDHPNARMLLNAVMREDLPDSVANSASQRDAEYEAWMSIHRMGQKASPEELGAILNGLTELEDVIVEPPKSTTAPVETAPVESFPNAEPIKETFNIVESKPTKSYEEWAAHPDIVEWRRDSLLSPALDAQVICNKYVQSNNNDLATDLAADFATVEEATKLVDNIKKSLDPEKVYTAAEIFKLWKKL